jgi:hypothetical protein
LEIRAKTLEEGRKGRKGLGLIGALIRFSVHGPTWPSEGGFL